MSIILTNMIVTVLVTLLVIFIVNGVIVLGLYELDKRYNIPQPIVSMTIWGALIIFDVIALGYLVVKTFTAFNEIMLS